MQLFRKFTRQQISYVEWLCPELTELVKPLLTNLQDLTNCGGLFQHIIQPFEKDSIIAANKCSVLLPIIKEKAFTTTEMSLLLQYFTSHFGETFHRVLILHKASTSEMFNGDLYYSSEDVVGGASSACRDINYNTLQFTNPTIKNGNWETFPDSLIV